MKFQLPHEDEPVSTQPPVGSATWAPGEGEGVIVPPQFDIEAVLHRTLDAIGQDPRWHPARHYRVPVHEPERDSRAGVHPSELNECLRATAYSIVRAPRRRDLDRRSVQTFDHGSVIHIQWQSYLVEAEQLGLFENVQIELEVHTENPPVFGHADATFWHDGYRYLVDIKSAGPSKFYGTKNLQGPMSVLSSVSVEHRRQVHAYMAGLGIYGAFMLYVDKALDAFKALWVPFDQAFWEAEIAAPIRAAVQMVDKFALPRKTDKRYLCRGCPFQGICDRDMGLVEADRRQPSEALTTT
mgnify:CR=1 FL=1